MSPIEIILLILGALICVLSFVIPMENSEEVGIDKKKADEEIKRLVSAEMASLKGHIDDVVSETIDYSMEKAERALERLSNEKIMAVNEYSDTVLDEIKKNHDSVTFLYDMLNKKHDNLKSAVTEVNNAVKEVAETKREAEAVVSNFQKISKEADVKPFTPKAVSVKPETEEKKEKSEDLKTMSFMPFTKGFNAAEIENINSNGLKVIDFNNQAPTQSNSNDKILALHKLGKSNVNIAKELGLGVGEVKLVIDLYKNM